MARVVIVNSSIPEFNSGIKVEALKALTSAPDGAEISFTAADQKLIVLVKNAHASVAKTVTFKKGDGIQGVEDKTFSIPFGETWAFALESGAFKQVSGTDKGKLLIIGESTDIQIQAIELP